MSCSAARQPRPVACIVLAAGGSRRLGTPKQLVRRRSQPLLRHIVVAARVVLPHAPLVVVLGPHALRLRLVLRRSGAGARAIANSRWAEGLATSLQTGIAAVPPGTRAALVLLADQPEVGAAALHRLLTAWRRWPNRPAAAHYSGHAGVPAVLPRRHWRAVRALRGDSGARALLRAAPMLTLVAMPEAVVDIDTPADLARLR